MTKKTKATATATKRPAYKAHRLTDAAGSKLIISIAETKDGKFKTAVAHRVIDGTSKPKTQRAMVEVHATKPEADARVERLIADAVKLGWKAKEKKAPKPPAFTELPKPAVVTPKPVTPIRKAS